MRHHRLMRSEWSGHQRRLLAVVALAIIIVLGDIIALNVFGEVSSALWILAVPVGFLVVPIIGVACAILLLADRRNGASSSG